MSTIYALFNPLSANRLGEEKANKLIGFFPNNDRIEFVDITTIKDYASLFAGLQPEDRVVICGGDGTINRFVNEIQDIKITNDVLYFATGSGNDFLREFNQSPEDGPVKINDYIYNLPIVTVEGKDYRFINGVGFGIDGYCCEVGDQLRNSSAKKINYTSIAIKGLLFHFKPRDAKVTVDGKEYNFKKVWIAPTMSGKYYGGGMMPIPEQSRDDRTDHVSICLFHGSGKLKTLMIFPNLFNGKHVKYKKNITILQGKNISVEYVTPCALQIDGETHLNIKRYDVRLADDCKSCECIAEKAEA